MRRKAQKWRNKAIPQREFNVKSEWENLFLSLPYGPGSDSRPFPAGVLALVSVIE